MCYPDIKSHMIRVAHFNIILNLTYIRLINNSLEPDDLNYLGHSYRNLPKEQFIYMFLSEISTYVSNIDYTRSVLLEGHFYFKYISVQR